jgi:hypothetical protein
LYSNLRPKDVSTSGVRRQSEILVNSFAVDGELSQLERYHLGVQLAAYLKQNHMNPRIAVVGKRPTTNGVAVGIVQNREVTAEVFPSEPEALEWLDKWPC